MKKFIFFLIIITSFIFLPQTAHAKTYQFYEGEYINGIYMNKYDPSTKTTYYQTARYFREAGTDKFAYCIEPFSFFQEESIYNETFNPENLSESQRKNISALAHYGFKYANHQEEKWYAITQLLIWKEADPNGDYYFTDSLNGKRVNLYENEINELKNLVANSYIKPSFDGKTYYVVKDQPLIIEDKNNVLNQYKSIIDYVKIDNNKLIITNLMEGNHQFSFERKDNDKIDPVVFYWSNDSQNLVETGNLDYTFSLLYVKVKSTKVTLNKIDKDTKTTTPSGEATLEGAVFELYDSNMKKLQEISLKNNKATLDNLNFGTYYLKEIKAGKGYTLNKDLIKFSLTENNTSINLELKNEVIKTKLQIYKEYGDENGFNPEADIEFNIYNSKKVLIKTIKTNKLGYAELELPYGSYYAEQVNTTDGYEKVQPFSFEVKDSSPIIYKLKNYKIKVPDTKIEFSLFTTIISLLKQLLC